MDATAVYAVNVEPLQFYARPLPPHYERLAMSHLERLLLTVAIIFFSLALGVAVKRASETNKLRVSPDALAKTRRLLQTVAIFVLLPAAAALSLWGLPHPKPGLFLLPLFGLFSYVWGGYLATKVAKFLKMNRGQTGAFYCCGAFTNIGAVGGLVCLMFLGEDSIALVALYRLTEEAYYFSVAFPIAKHYGPDNTGTKLCFASFKPNATLTGIVVALLCGLGLNIAGAPRPEVLGSVASASMLLATFFFLFSIGLTLRITRAWNYKRFSLWMCAIKFIGAPALIVALAWLLGFGDFENGLPLKVVAILSSMPVAMTALVPPSLFRLDVDLANACWIFTTAALPIVLSALIIVLPAL